MNIPEEAVEAAARALNDSTPLVARWESAAENVKEMRRTQARIALKASAAPLLAKGWDEGNLAARRDAMNAKKYSTRTRRNPYRKEPL